MENSVYDYFVKAQSEFKPIEKNKIVKVKLKDNKGQYEFAYADLDEILSKIKPALHAHGFGISWTTVGKTMYCRLMHRLGIIESSVDMVGNAHTSQEGGGLLTFYRRYSLVNCAGICAEDDSDTDEGAEDFSVNKKTYPKKEAQDFINKNQSSGTQGPVVTEPQIKRMFAIANQNEVTDEQIKKYLKEKFNLDTTRALNRSQYDQICKALEGGEFH